MPQLVALIITIAYGVGFAFVPDRPAWYAAGGALVVAAAWVIVGMLHTRSAD